MDRQFSPAASDLDDGRTPPSTRNSSSGRFPPGALSVDDNVGVTIWSSEPLVVVSPMSYLRAYEQIRRGLAPRRGWGPPAPGEDGYSVVGSMGNRWIRMEAVPSGSRNSFRPVARMRLESLDQGSRLAGTARVPLLIRVLSAVWLGVAGCFTAAAVVIDADRLVTGRAEWADGLFVLVPAAMIAFFGALTSWASGSGGDDLRYLRAWLAERLDGAQG
jgi:hypothetical protein